MTFLDDVDIWTDELHLRKLMASTGLNSTNVKLTTHHYFPLCTTNIADLPFLQLLNPRKRLVPLNALLANAQMSGGPSDKSGSAIRHCGENGRWVFSEDAHKTWVDYSDCYKFLPPEDTLRHNIEDGTVNRTFHAFRIIAYIPIKGHYDHNMSRHLFGACGKSLFVTLWYCFSVPDPLCFVVFLDSSWCFAFP